VNQQVIIATGKNGAPEHEINEKLQELGPEWKIVSATTALAPFGALSQGMADQFNVPVSSAAHVYYVTTVVVEKTE
jgi:hypothetical protein